MGEPPLSVDSEPDRLGSRGAHTKLQPETTIRRQNYPLKRTGIPPLTHFNYQGPYLLLAGRRANPLGLILSY